MEHRLLKRVVMSPPESSRSRAQPEPISVAPLRPAEPNQVRLLLERGLELFGRDELQAAVRCWQRVLELAPSHAQALEYLSAAAGEERAPVSNVSERTRRDGQVVDRELLRAHLAQGNYQEAWQVLGEALRSYPDDPELIRARDLLEPRVALRIAQHVRLSTRPAIPPSANAALQADLDERQRELLRLAQSSQSYAQILARSPFGEAETLLGLRSLEELGLLAGSGPRPPREPARRSTAASLELDLSHVEGVKQCVLLGDLDELSASSSDLSARCIAELSSALRLLGADEALLDAALLTVDEIQIVRRIGASGAVAAVTIDRSSSQLALARLQVEMACHKLENR